MASNKGTSLRKYALVRLALVVPMVFVVLTLVFLLMRVAPGNPIPPRSVVTLRTRDRRDQAPSSAIDKPI